LRDSLASFISTAETALPEYQSKQMLGEWVNNAQRLKQLLESRVIVALENMPSCRNVYDASTWAFLVYSMFQTSKVIGEMFMYESFFDQAGEEIAKLNAMQHTEIAQMVQKLIDIQEQMIILSINSSMSKTSMSPLYQDKINHIALDADSFKLKRSAVEFFKLADSYSEHSLELDEVLNRTQTKINECFERTKKDEKFYSDNQQKSFKTMLIHIGYAAGTAAVSTIFPPAAPSALIAYLPSIFGGIMAGVNGGLSYMASKHREKATYRLSQFTEVQNEIFKARDSTLKFIEKFEKLRNEFLMYAETNAEFFSSTSTITSGDNSNRLLNSIKQIIYNYPYITIQILLISIWTAIFSSIIRREFRNNKPQPGRSIKWFIAFCAVCLIISLSVDMFESTRTTRSTIVQARDNKLIVHTKSIEQRYKHECIWFEIPVWRQVALETKAYLWDLLMQDGARYLARNSSGHLVNDPICIHLMLAMNSNHHALHSDQNIQNDAEIVGTTYSSLIKGFITPLTESTIQTLETFTSKTSFTTKLWLLGVTAGIVLIIVKRVLFCC
jgi:hypothetical protein